MNVNFRVEYEPIKLRHVAVECPYCKNWFRGWDITEDELFFETDLHFAEFHCPKCGKWFKVMDNSRDHHYDIDERDYPEVYKDCLERKEVWE